MACTHVRRPVLHAIGILAILAASGCLPTRSPSLPMRLTRLGPERTAIRYDDPRAAEKTALLDRINRDRAQHGVAPLRYEPRAALAGDRFCLDAALSGSWGHWDLLGRAPHLRWGLAGGVDFHAENAASFTVSSGMFRETLLDLMLESHQAMMDEVPPKDGHRRTILDPDLTHVGIGVARVGGQFRMTQEFSRVAFEWMEVPDGPLRAGGKAVFSGQPLRDWEVGLVEIRFEPPPRPLDRRDLETRGSYGYPPVATTLGPRPPFHAQRYAGGGQEFESHRHGRVTLEFPLDRGPGYYFVLCYMRPRGRLGEAMRPGSAAMIAAQP